MTLLSLVPPPDDEKFESKLERLADKLVDEALGERSFAERLDTFKVLSNYQVQMKRVGSKVTDDAEAGSDFRALKRRIQEAADESA